MHPAKIDPEETSTKKYPYNKYYQFQDEDSSGRKYIKDTFNLELNPSQQKQAANQSLFDLDRDYAKYCQPKPKEANKSKLKKKMPSKSKEKTKKCFNKSVIHSVSSVRNSTKRKLT